MARVNDRITVIFIAFFLKGSNQIYVKEASVQKDVNGFDSQNFTLFNPWLKFIQNL
jgi:hypothetical protein